MKGHAYRPDTLYEVVLRDGGTTGFTKPDGRYLRLCRAVVRLGTPFPVSWSCGSPAPSPAPARRLFLICSSNCSLMRPIGRYGAQAGISLVKRDFRTELCRHEGLVGLPVVLPKVPAALKLVMQTRFRRPPHPRSLRHDVPRHRNGHDPHWLPGFPDRRDADGTVRSGLEGTDDESGPNAGHAPQCEIPGRPRVLPPGELVIQSGGPLAAGAAHREGGRNTVKARECVTPQGSEVEDRGGAPAELAARFSAATRTQPHEPSRSAGAIRSHSSADVSEFRLCILMQGSVSPFAIRMR